MGFLLNSTGWIVILLNHPDVRNFHYINTTIYIKFESNKNKLNGYTLASFPDNRSCCFAFVVVAVVAIVIIIIIIVIIIIIIVVVVVVIIIIISLLILFSLSLSSLTLSALAIFSLTLSALALPSFWSIKNKQTCAVKISSSPRKQVTVAIKYTLCNQNHWITLK